MDELKSWFEVPAIAHFFHVFKNSFGLIEFEIEDFEEALFLDSAENVSSFLPDLVIQLLRGLYKTKDGLQVTTENYDHYLQDLLQYRYETIANKANPVATKSFKTLTTRQKVDILYDMCDWRLELQDSMDLTKNLEAEEMRITPVGSDAEGYQYWYFYGTRLFKEKCADEIKEEIDTASENEAVVKPKAKPKKRKGKKRKSCTTTTKSGRAVKPRLDYSSQSDNAMSEEEKVEESMDGNNPAESKEDLEVVEKPILRPHEDGQWSLVCSTVQEWADLIEYFKNPRNKNEKILLKGLKELNEVIPDIFIEKAKALHKKLFSLAPKRSSDRILVKLAIRDEEERKLEQQRIFKTQQKVKEAEQRQNEQKLEKEKEREKRYLERERNLEQRALRAKQREELKLVAENPELAKEIQLANKDKKNYNTLNFDAEGDEDDKFFIMEKVLEIVKDHDDAWPFLEPVDAEEAPNYYEFIEHPMDLSKITGKIKNKEYKDKNEFEDDMHLIFDNCETYNGTYSPFTKYAFKVKKVFEKQMKKEFPPEKDIKDDELYEDLENKKTCLNIKAGRVPQVLTPKEKMSSGIHAFKSNNAILTPEFAHAQILQAQAQLLHKAQTQQNLSGIPQILPKLGIPQDILAKLTPAQMQLLMMQLRSGNLSSSNSIKFIKQTSSPGLAPKLSTLNAARPTFSGTPQRSTMSHLNITPKSIVNSGNKQQVPRLVPKKTLSMTQLISSPKNLANLGQPSPGTTNRHIRPSNYVRYVGTSNGQSNNLTFLANSSGKIPIRPVASPNNPTQISSILLQQPKAQSKSLGLPGSVLISSTASPNVAGIPMITHHSLNPSINRFSNASPSSVINKIPMSALSGGRLLIQGKNAKIAGIPTSSTSVTGIHDGEAMKKLGLPILGQSNVRYIGQPDGKLQKVVYLQQSPSISAGSTAASQFPGRVRPVYIQQPQHSAFMRGVNTVRNIRPVIQHVQQSFSSTTLTRPVMPVYLTPQGVPLQVIKPSGNGLSAPVSATVASAAVVTVASTGIIGNRLGVATMPNVHGRVWVKTQQQLATTATNSQNLQGLKMAVQQVAAVTQINAKLQNHLENKNNMPLALSGSKSINPLAGSKVTISSLSNDKKVLNSPIALKVPVRLQSQSVLPSTAIIPKIASAGTVNGSYSGVVSPIRTVGKPHQQQILPSTIKQQPGISFILTSNGLVSVSLPTTPALQPRTSGSVASTQNIITSRIPSIFGGPSKAQYTPVGSLSGISSKAVVTHSITKTISTPQIVRNYSSVTTPNIKSLITPEKLRDAEALLGLINPTRLHPAAAPVSRQNAVNALTMNTPKYGGVNSTPNSASVPYISKAVNSIPSTQHLAKIVERQHTNGASPVKIQIPSSKNPTAATQNELASNYLPSNPSGHIVNPMTGQVKIQLPAVQQTATPTIAISMPSRQLQQTSNNISVSANGNTVTTSPTINVGHKMIVDAAQLLKLRDEGKVIVTPSGQMFLLANNTMNATSK